MNPSTSVLARGLFFQDPSLADLELCCTQAVACPGPEVGCQWAAPQDFPLVLTTSTRAQMLSVSHLDPRTHLHADLTGPLAFEPCSPSHHPHSPSQSDFILLLPSLLLKPPPLCLLLAKRLLHIPPWA